MVACWTVRCCAGRPCGRTAVRAKLLILLVLIKLIVGHLIKLFNLFNLNMIKKRLLSTGEVVTAIDHQISQVTINRYTRAGLLRPTRRTPGGFARWDLDDFLRQMEALRKRRG